MEYKDFKSKYLKYKQKYIGLKNLYGGLIREKNGRKEYVIVNFYPRIYQRSMAEMIPRGKLKVQMTNHGIGSGFYGFIDPDMIPQSKLGVYHDYEPKEFILYNPLILEDNIIMEDYEQRSDNDRFSAISTLMNNIVYNIYDKYILKNRVYNIDEIVKKEFEYIELQITKSFKVDIEKIIKSINEFLEDYKLLMKTQPDEEHYLFMPINYLLHNYDFDGIYNIGGNTASRGSVKYFFNEKYPARGFPADFKLKPESLKGNLIFKGNFIS
jgi:hypothetical protein